MSVTDHLPVADARQVRRAVWRLIRADRRAMLWVVALYVLAAGAGVAGPLLLGEIVDRVRSGASVSTIDRLAALIVVFVAAELLLNRYARYAGHRFGERALARMREGFVEHTLRIPMSTVEQAGTGDLLTRNATDVGTVGTMLRDAAPEMFICVVQVIVIMAALFYLQPLLGLCVLLLAPPVYLGTRWYLRRARDGYLAEGTANTELSEALAASADGGRTVEVYRLAERRVGTGDHTIRAAHRTRVHTLYLRCVFFPCLDGSYALPTVGMLIVGGAMYFNDMMSLGTVVAAVMLARQFNGPFDRVFMWIENVQRGSASLARVEGVGLIDDDRGTGTATPAGDRLEVRDVRYSYGGGRDVLHGIDLEVRPGERLAVVGPSGAGKSTLGRLLAGIDAPRTGGITLGGVAVAELPPEELRTRIALVTQDHHVFIGTLRDNLRLAKHDATDAELTAALAAVDADWAAELPDGLDTEFGAGLPELDAAAAQQLALARIVLADPHTVILDEATSMLDPTAARHTERSLAAVLAGRTVIAIAHRLHTAHDADRVAVVDDGRITELGSHAELVAAGGPYATLWQSWHG